MLSLYHITTSPTEHVFQKSSMFSFGYELTEPRQYRQTIRDTNAVAIHDFFHTASLKWELLNTRRVHEQRRDYALLSVTCFFSFKILLHILAF